MLHQRSPLFPQCLPWLRVCWVCSPRLLVTAAWWSRRPGSPPGDSGSPPRRTTTTRRQTAGASPGTRSPTGAGAGHAATPGTSPGRGGGAGGFVEHLQDKLVTSVCIIRSEVSFQPASYETLLSTYCSGFPF